MTATVSLGPSRTSRRSSPVLRRFSRAAAGAEAAAGSCSSGPVEFRPFLRVPKWFSSERVRKVYNLNMNNA